MFAALHVRALLGFALILGSVLSSCSSDGAGIAREDAKIFKGASSILDEIAAREDNGIPEAVLNRTRCVFVFPAASNEGVASCYEALNRWTRPDLISFTGRRPPNHDLLVLLLGERESESFRSRGRLVLDGKTRISPGPLVRSKAVVTDADLYFAALVYERAASGLTGGTVQGRFAASNARPAGLASTNDRSLQLSLASFFNTITPNGIIIHHTATLPTSRNIPRNQAEIDAYHSQKGFDVVCFGREYHVAYHYLILPNGEVQPGRPERCQGAHAKAYNAHIGISLAGDFSGRRNHRSQDLPAPTAQQQRSLIELCRRLQAKYGIPVHRIMRHSDVSATECPGERFPFLKILAAVGR
jgi:N-acetylmuramoyl-L-alanine amidase